MDLRELVEGLDVEIRYPKTGEKKAVEIRKLCADSRLISVGDAFVCLTGGNVNAHTYAKQAVASGASALIVEKWLPIDVPQVLVKDTREAIGLLAGKYYGNPSRNLRVIAITGTNGKTTTAHMLAEILNKAGKRTGVIGTLGVKYDDVRYETGLTTPDPIELQRILAEMLAKGIEYVVMEVSAHALYYRKTAGIRFAAAIFTNLSHDHLDFFKGMQDYGLAKERLFEKDVCKIAVLNGDDGYGRRIGRKREENGENVVYYGLDEPADAFAVITEENIYGTSGVLNIKDNLTRFSLSLTGVHNVYNALAAATCAVELGISIDDVAQGLFALEKVDGRLEWVASANGADVFVDFAHTPDGLKKSLETLRKHCKKRLICLFGCGGNRDKSKRAVMGETAAKGSDFSVLTSDNPRYEDPMGILAEIERGYRRFSGKYVVVPERKKGLAYALEYLQEGDVLLVAGKGGELTQEIMGIKYPFNDKDIIEGLLKDRAKNNVFRG